MDEWLSIPSNITILNYKTVLNLYYNDNPWILSHIDLTWICITSKLLFPGRDNIYCLLKARYYNNFSRTFARSRVNAVFAHVLKPKGHAFMQSWKLSFPDNLKSLTFKMYSSFFFPIILMHIFHWVVLGIIRNYIYTKTTNKITFHLKM